MAETILSSPLFTEIILPFLLVFTIIFAILERTKILGEEKRQVNAIVGLVVALIVVAFSYPTGIIIKLMPVLAVLAVIILVFMILYGFVASSKEGFEMPKALQITFGILIAIVLIIALLVITGYWEKLPEIFSSNIITNILFIIAIIVAIVVVTVWGKGSD